MRKTVRVDLSVPAARWHRIQLACAVALFFGLDTIVSIVFNVLKDLLDGKPVGPWGLGVEALTLLLAGFLVRQTWKHGALFNRQSLQMLKVAFEVVAVAMGLFSALAWFVVFTSSSDADGAQTFLGGTLTLFEGIYCVIVVVAIRRLTSSRIDGIDRPMRELLDDTLARAGEAPPEAYALVRTDRPMGLVWIALGAVVFVLGSILGSYLEDALERSLANHEHFTTQLLQLATAVEIIGALLVLKGRAYFTPKAEAVLAIDKRAPILYLRSFLDETPDTVQMSGASSAVVDRSFEMKVARYFLPFGPFVAIGSPKDALPKLGATRLLRAADDWQGEVTTLMGRAQLILASVGHSNWIKWELSEALRLGLEGKSLFIFPSMSGKGFGWLKKKLAVQRERIDALKGLYPPGRTPDYGVLEPKEFLLAQATTGDQAYLLTTRSSNANANGQVLAVVVAHYLLARGLPPA